MTEHFWISLLEYLDPIQRMDFCDKLQKIYHISVHNYENISAPKPLLAKQLAKWKGQVMTALGRHYFKNYKTKDEAIDDFSPHTALYVLRFLLLHNDFQEDFMIELMNRETASNDVQTCVQLRESPKRISLCRVNHPDQYGNIWIERIADYSNNTLDLVTYDSSVDPISDNRELIFLSDGPDTPSSIGLWEWFDYPQQNEDSVNWRTESTFIEKIHPIEVVSISDAPTHVSKIIEKLISGIDIPQYLHEPLLFVGATNSDGYTDAILYEERYFDVTTSEKVNSFHLSLKHSIYSLPCYQINEHDWFIWKNRQILNKTTLNSPCYIPIIDTDKLIQEILMDRMTKSLYKETIGRTIREWRECKRLFELVCEPSLYDEISEKLNCSFEEAETKINSFIAHIDSAFDLGDIDSDILARIVESHEGLRNQCESSIEEHWKKSHAEEIAAAEAEANQIKEQIKTSKKEHQTLLEETSNAKSKLKQLLRKIEEYEALGTNTVQAIRKKIGAAQQDMAGFIAELSAFMPQQATQDSSFCEIKPTNRWIFTSGTVCNDAENIESCSSWRDTLILLDDNLRLAGVGSQWSGMLSSFLYSAYLNKMPLLLAGPNAEAIANTLSMTLLGKTIEILKCNGEQNSEAISEYTRSELAAIQNPFHPDWINCIPQITNNGFTLWLHPFTEDLLIEPKSLYNYAYPIFTECFVDQLPSTENMVAGQMTERYTSFKSDPHYRAKLVHIKRLGMSRLIINRLEKVLADAKYMGAVSNVNMEYLFGMLPLSVLSGKHDILTELLNNEKNLTTEVKTELQRYVEE